ncbi:MAG: DUF2202 domain-containing protein, partial [Candidatus Aminicenantes bacterium]|nr:DUF2202 domain-containing protein [Candidatus Aminicenantes bacterium]
MEVGLALPAGPRRGQAPVRFAEGEGQPDNIGADPTAGLDETEIHYLVFIREEKKMARDVYLFLYDKWGNPVFASIAKSEQ